MHFLVDRACRINDIIDNRYCLFKGVLTNGADAIYDVITQKGKEILP